jgi:DNA-binding transcriptional MerR regulator
MKLLSISRFAQLAQLPVTTLRHWADLGVLEPAEVDPQSGYRYYSTKQLAVATDIRLLRTLEIPLDDVVAILRLETAAATDAVHSQARALARRAEAQQRVASYVTDRLTTREERARMDVIEMERTDQPVLSRRRMDSIDELSPWLTSAFEDLFTTVHDRGLTVEGAPFTVFHSPVTDDTDGDVEACLPVAGKGADRVVRGGVAITAHARGLDAEYPRLITVYERLAEWAADHERELGGPPYEVYHSSPDDPAEAQHIQVVWPLVA